MYLRSCAFCYQQRHLVWRGMDVGSTGWRVSSHRKEGEPGAAPHTFFKNLPCTASHSTHPRLSYWQEMLLSKDAVTLFQLKHGPLCFKNDFSFKIPQDRVSYRKDRLEVKWGSTKKKCMQMHVCFYMCLQKFIPLGTCGYPSWAMLTSLASKCQNERGKHNRVRSFPLYKLLRKSTVLPGTNG